MADPSKNDSADFIDQARWLLEWHNRRGETFTTRAVALLGFVGVFLTLLLQGAALRGITATSWTWVFLGGSLAALLWSGLFAVCAIAPREIVVPKVNQLRHWWKVHAAEPYPGTSAPKIAESFLNSSDLSKISAVSSAMEAANQRGKHFRKAVGGMLVAFFFLTLLLCNILWHTWGK